MPRNRVHWTWFLYIEIESNGLNFYVQKLSSVNLVFVHINQVQWTRFLYIEIESIGLDFFSALHVSCRSHSKNFQNNTYSLSHSLPLSVSLSLSLSLSFHLASYSHSLSLRLSLSFPLAPSPSVSVSLIPLCSVAVVVPTIIV